jgi:hypothetical protein
VTVTPASAGGARNGRCRPWALIAAAQQIGCILRGTGRGAKGASVQANSAPEPKVDHSPFQKWTTEMSNGLPRPDIRVGPVDKFVKLRANLSQETESNADMVLRLLSAASRRCYVEAPDAESAILTCPEEGGSVRHSSGPKRPGSAIRRLGEVKST